MGSNKADEDDFKAESLHLDTPYDAQISWQWQSVEEDGSEEVEDGEWCSFFSENGRRIEQAFQSGMDRIRVKYLGQIPMELFFHDKVLYNPICGSIHKIRRVGPERICQRIARKIRSYVRSLVNGTVRHKTFLRYKKQLSPDKYAIKKKAKQARNELCRRVVNGPLFAPLQALMITLNTVYLGVEADGDNTEESSIGVLSHFFCLFFMGELAVRFGAMNKKSTLKKALSQVLDDSWFAFDLILVLLMMVQIWLLPLVLISNSNSGELGILRIVRVVRLSRFGRIIRLLQLVPEVVIMLKGLTASLRAVICSCFFMILLLYVFALIFKSQAQNTQLQEMFPNIPISMKILLVHGALMDNLGDALDTINDVSGTLAFLFFVFLFLSNLMVLNMLVGVICDVATDVGKQEKQMLDLCSLKHDLNEFLDFYVTAGDQITLHAFELLLGNPDAMRMLERHHVDIDTLAALKMDLFKDKDAMAASNSSRIIEKSLTYDEFVTVLTRFQQGQGGPATTLDILNLERRLEIKLSSEVNEKIGQSLSRQLSTLISESDEGPMYPMQPKSRAQIGRDFANSGPAPAHASGYTRAKSYLPPGSDAPLDQPLPTHDGEQKSNEDLHGVLTGKGKPPAEWLQNEQRVDGQKEDASLHVLCEQMSDQMKLLASKQMALLQLFKTSVKQIRQDTHQTSIEGTRQAIHERTTMLEHRMNQEEDDCAMTILNLHKLGHVLQSRVTSQVSAETWPESTASHPMDFVEDHEPQTSKTTRSTTITKI